MKAWQKLLAANLLMLITCMVFFAKGVLAVECCTSPWKVHTVDLCVFSGSAAIKDNNCKGGKCDVLINQCISVPTPTPTPTIVTVPVGTGCCVAPYKPVNDLQCVHPGSKAIISNECKGGKCDTVKNECANTPGSSTSPYDPCKNDASGKCNDCKNKDGTWTAIGCLPNEPSALVGHLIGIGGGIAGGIAFLLMLWGAAQLVLSRGIPEKIQGAKDTITSAVIGLVFIFLSVLILKLIGVQILGIPGWS
jgi:hypothetical protein